jgi:predicted PurR-regulated permease PerM
MARSSAALCGIGVPLWEVSIHVDLKQRSLSILAVLGLIWMLKFAQAILVPIVLAVLISYVLEPAVAQLQRLRIPRAVGAALVLLSATAILGAGVYLFSDDVLTIIDDLPSAADKLRQKVVEMQGGDGVVDKVKEAATAIEETAVEAAGPAPAPQGVTKVQIEEKPLDLSGFLVWGSVGVLSWIGSLVLLIFLIYFLLISGNLFRKKLVKITGSASSKRRVTIEILDEIHVQIARWVGIQVFTGSVVAAASFVAFQAIGLEQAGVWAVTAGICNTIPYFGPLFVSAVVAVAALLQFDTLTMALYTGFIALAITTLEGYLLTPYVTGRAIRMNGVAVFIGLLFWTWLWNLWGIVLAIPMLVIIKSVSDRVEGLTPIGELLGE